MEFNELMKQFTEKCEVRDVTVEDDVVALEIDGVVFAFIHDPGSAVLTVVADLGQQSIDADGPFGAMMLQANFLFEATRGATLFQNPENKSFGLQQQYRLVYLDADMLAAEVEKLANVADEWKDVLSGIKAAEEALGTHKAAEADASRLVSGGDFMRV